MAFDIKKIAIALGCAGVVAFVIGRINSGSNDNGYQPITSFSEQGESLVQQGQMQIQELSQSVVTENIRQLPGQLLDETPISIDTPTALLETPNQFEAKPLVEDENQFMISQPEMVEVDMVEEDSDLVLDFAEEPMQDDVSTPAQPEAPQADAVTEQMVEQPKPAVEKPAVEKPAVRQAKGPRKSIGSDWKKNPFLSNMPSKEPNSMVKPASMAVTAQSVRSLNEIGGIPNLAPNPAPNTTKIPEPITPVTPEMHSPESMVSGGTPIGTPIGNSIVHQITPVQIQLSEAAAQKAVHHIEYGKSLTRRGAIYAARHEFFSALRVVAEANDATVNGNDFSMALSKAIRAMKEAEDFNVNDAQSFAVVNVPATIEAHKTKLLTDVEARRITPLNAMQQYYAYAGQQLDFAGGRNVVTAEALHCLGKLHSVISSDKPSDANKTDTAQAIVFHQSSLLSNPNNPASTNELGVLLAKSGNLEGATDLFKRSLITQPTPQAWSNLAKTHHRLGEQGMAQMAQAEIAVAAQSTSIATAGIQWIDTPQFNAMAPLEFEPRIARQTPAVVPASTETEEEEKPASIAQRIKDWF